MVRLSVGVRVEEQVWRRGEARGRDEETGGEEAPRGVAGTEEDQPATSGKTLLTRCMLHSTYTFGLFRCGF